VTARKAAARPPGTAAAPPVHRGPQLAYARDDALGSTRDAILLPRLLIVEDDFLVALAAEAALREAGFEVTGVVASAEEAIERATAQRPVLVIMDVRLSGGRDGIEAAIQLFRDHGIPCIFATAHADAIARSRAAPAKPLGWLQKPYSMPDLVALVRHATDELGKSDR
jgi:two-component system, response regulator PdtaR